MPFPLGGTVPVSRFYGSLLLILLLAGGFGLRHRSLQRTARIFEGEARAEARLQDLAGTFQREFQADVSPAKRLASLGRQVGLTPLQGTGDDSSAFAQDNFYVYGLGLTSVVDSKTGRHRPSWALRAWPRQFGVTGDLEYHVNDRGVLWHGQNEVGRSGTDAGFPPSFSKREFEDSKQKSWWRPDRGLTDDTDSNHK